MITPLAILFLSIHTFHYASKLVETIQHTNAQSEALEISLRIQNQLTERATDLKVLAEVWENHKKDSDHQHLKKIAEGFISGNSSYNAINLVDANSIIRVTMPKEKEPVLLGKDLKMLPGRTEMHASVRSSRQPLASTPIELEEKYPGFVIWQPLGENNQGKFQGLLAATIKIDSLVKVAFQQIPCDSFTHSITIDNQPVYSNLDIADKNTKKTIVKEHFQTLGRTWTVSVSPKDGTALTMLGEPIKWNLLIGIFLSLLTGLLLFLTAYMNRQLFMAKAASNASEEDLRITLLSIGDAVIVTNTDGIITNMNPIAEKLTGWSIQQAVGLPLNEVFKIINAHTRLTVTNPVELVLKSGEIKNLANHTILISKDGTEYQIADSGAPIRDDYGTIRGVVLVFRDITEEYILQEQLQQSQKLQSIGQLAGGVAHDFNNILAGIMGSAELLQKTNLNDPKSTKYLSLILKSAERASELTEKLLAFARKRISNSNIFDVNHAITDAIDLLKSTSDPRIQFNLNLHANPNYVDGDLMQMQNAFLNIALNAVQAMPNGGRLNISSSLVMLDREYCQASQFALKPGHYIKIEFYDTGSGIDPKNFDKIFDPFFTTKSASSGTGLGLSVVYGTILRHRGAITANNESTGTSFHVLLPLSDKETENIVSTNKYSITGTGHILLIDDEEAMRVTGAAILEDLGYEVTLAANGREGLEIFKAKHDSFDLVILDMIMPEMNGSDCFAALQNIRKEIPVILSSGFTHEEDLQSMMNQGLRGFIRKPFKAAELSALIHKVLHPLI